VIGSVKGNIGHLEITSFLAQLSKACSLLRTGELAPQANLKTLNPAIHWVNHKIRVATTPALNVSSHATVPESSLCRSVALESVELTPM
jgi:acyl transferase domain-containing protein